MSMRTVGAWCLAVGGLLLAGCAGAASGNGGPGSAAIAASASVTPVAKTSAPATAVGSASPSSSPGQLWLWKLGMTSATSGWALYDPGDPADPATGSLTLLARTTDGARSWTDVTPAAALPMLSAAGASQEVDPVNGQRAYLAVSAATQVDSTAPSPAAVFATADGGQTWTESVPFTVDGPVVQVTFANAEDGWLLLDVGLSSLSKPLPWLYRTTDGGHDWVPVTAAAPPGTSGPNDMCNELALSFPTATTGWLTVGCRSGGYVFVTHDGGSTWAAQPLPVPVTAGEAGPPSVTGPRFTGGTGFLTVAPESGSPSLLATEDLGQSWNFLPLPAGAGQYPQVSFFSATQGVVVPAAAQDAIGTVFYTTDNGGKTWTPVQQGTHFTQLGGAVDFVSPQDGFAWTLAGDAQSATPPPIYATTNSGSTWTPFTPALSG